MSTIHIGTGAKIWINGKEFAVAFGTIMADNADMPTCYVSSAVPESITIKAEVQYDRHATRWLWLAALEREAYRRIWMRRLYRGLRRGSLN